MPVCEHKNVQLRQLPCYVYPGAYEMAGGVQNLLLTDQICDDCNENVPFGAATVDDQVLDEIIAAQIALEAEQLISSERFVLPRLGRRHRRIHEKSVEHGWRVANLERRADFAPRALILPDVDIGVLACELRDALMEAAERPTTIMPEGR